MCTHSLPGVSVLNFVAKDVAIIAFSTNSQETHQIIDSMLESFERLKEIEKYIALLQTLSFILQYYTVV